jgi:hypothetical protein
MKPAKIFIIFTFLFLAFALQISAQDKTPKIVWKNLKEKYEKFEDIVPIVFNDSEFPIFMPKSFLGAIEYGHISLLKFDESQNKWMRNYIAFCGTLTKQERKNIAQNLVGFKLDLKTERQIRFDGLELSYLIKSDIGSNGFTELAHYNGTGRYKFQVYFSRDMKKFFLSESPEFEVIEKDFKK